VVIRVELGDRSYPICIDPGGLAGLGPAVVDAIPGVQRCILVTTDGLADLHGGVVLAALGAAGIAVDEVRIPDGESQKTVATWSALVAELLDIGVQRNIPVVALGGGVTGDIVGFAAATVLRGVPLVQVPTTLLAMVDSAVGGKTGVNTAHGKNLVGAFYQPSLVFAAMDTLQTLPPRELRCGLGEVVKHAVLGDHELFEFCVDRAAQVSRCDGTAMVELVHRCCRVKADVVSQDEREAGLRAVLNLGHTVGHAIETVLAGTDDALPHGECVAIGLLAEARWAAGRGDCAPDVPERIAALLSALDLPTAPPRVDRAAIEVALGFDKKFRHGRLRTAVVEAIGRVRLADIDAAEALTMFHSIPGIYDA
jgi:3-dehydroquinate synthase